MTCFAKQQNQAIYSSSDSKTTVTEYKRQKDKENISNNIPNGNVVVTNVIDAQAGPSSKILPDITNLKTFDVSKGTQYSNCDYVIVKCYSKNTNYLYLRMCMVEMDDEDGEIKIMCLKVLGNEGKTFKIDESAVYDVRCEDIINRLHQPTLCLKGERIYLKFKTSVDVFEQ